MPEQPPMPDPDRRPAPTGLLPDPPDHDLGADDAARLEALIDRLTELEGGLRAELAAQVQRTEAAETALVAAEARAATAEIQARTTTPRPGAPTAASEEVLARARTDAARILADARAEAAQASSGDRDALRAALAEMKRYLERRRGLEAEVLSVAREAVGALGGGSTAS